MLVITLWLIMVLAMVAVALSRFLSTETRLIRYHGARAQARAWAEAGIRFGMQRLREDANAYDWLGERWATPSPDDPAHPTTWTVSFPGEAPQQVALKGSVSITITDEERNLNLNTATESVLAAFLGDAEAAKALVGYRSPEDEGADHSMKPPYQPKHAPLAVLEETWDIPAIRASSRVQQFIREHGTVSTDGAVNINTASSEVLTALANDANLAERLIASRPGIDGRFGASESGGTDDDCKAMADTITEADNLARCAGVADSTPVRNLLARTDVGVAVGVSSSVFRIRAEGATAQPMTRYAIEAVVKRQRTEEPVILAWKEQ